MYFFLHEPHTKCVYVVSPASLTHCVRNLFRLKNDIDVGGLSKRWATTSLQTVVLYADPASLRIST